MRGKMVTTNSKQMTTGKAFEYALLSQFEEKVKNKTNVQVIKNSSFDIAKGCFENTSKTEQADYLLSSSFAVNFLMDIEPRLNKIIGFRYLSVLRIKLREIVRQRLQKEPEVKKLETAEVSLVGVDGDRSI